jgi:hypothetical protein
VIVENRPGAGLAAMNVADAALWAPIIKDANIKVE